MSQSVHQFTFGVFRTYQGSQQTTTRINITQHYCTNVQAMQGAAHVTELEVPLSSRVAWLRKNYSYFEDQHKDVLMGKLDALTKTSGKKVCR